MTTKARALGSPVPSLSQSEAKQTVAVTGPLAMPIPDGCSDLYASGWACADAYVVQGTDFGAEAGDGWDVAKAQGFWDRLKAERERKAALCSATLQ